MAKKTETEGKTRPASNGEREWKFSPELMDELLGSCESPSELTGPDGLLRSLIGALVSVTAQAV